MANAIEFTHRSEKQLGSLPVQAQQRIRRRIDDLADDPRPRGTVKMEGREGQYRIRVGDYRVIYQIKDDVLLVLVIDIGNRREIYR